MRGIPALTAVILTMLCTSLIAIIATLPLLTTTVSAASSRNSSENSRVIPCAVGNGVHESCESCDESKAIEVTQWEQATWVKNFSMGRAPAEVGTGYKVFWVRRETYTEIYC